MKNSSRRQVRTPVGNKTKRGAELEGTPKTPCSFEVSPYMSSSVDSVSQQPEDQRLRLRSRRPLQWNNLAQQGISAMAVGGVSEDSFETTLCPFLHKDSKSVGGSKQVTVLSPICMNAIEGNSDLRGGWKAAPKPNEVPPSLLSPTTTLKDCEALAFERKGHGRIFEDAHRNASEADDGVGSGSCASSPRSRSPKPEAIFFWSNAAFNQGLAHEATASRSKDSASSSRCSSSSLSSRLKAAIIEQADCEAASKTIDQDPLPRIDGGQNCNADREKVQLLMLESTLRMGRFCELADQKTKSSGSRDDCIEPAEGTLARKLLFENDKSSSCVLVSELDHGVSPSIVQQRSDTKECTDLQKSVLEANQAANEEARLEIGLQEIEKEIQCLSERLTELQLQKRIWEKEIGRHSEVDDKKIESVHVGRGGAADTEMLKIAVLQQRQSKQSAMTGARRGKAVGATLLQSPRAQSLKSHYEVVLKVKEESPLASASRQAQCPSTASVGKPLELGRSVSAANRRKESSSRSIDAAVSFPKMLRRLSMSGVTMSSPSNVNGQQQQQRSVPNKGQQQQQRSLPNKGSCTLSRVVSSRYGNAITSDACRISCKKQDQLSRDAALQTPQASASTMHSALKKITTPRSGYPSRTGFVTPTKEHQQPRPFSSIRTPAICLSQAAASYSSISPRAHSAGHLLHSSNRSPNARVDSPKSTAALYKCLESLLEDSKPCPDLRTRSFPGIGT